MKTFVVLLSLFAATPLWAGDHAGNGGGIAEGYLALAFNSLERYIELCLAAESCQITPTERVILQEIRSSHSLERAMKDPLIFKSERHDPGTFLIDGLVRIAKTANNVGEPIFINQDLLYTIGPMGAVVPLTYASAVTLLIHELGHHHGMQGPNSHEKLDNVGAKVARLLQSQTQETSISPFQKHIIATGINFSLGRGNSTQLLLTTGTGLIDLTSQLRNAVTCKNSSSKTPLNLMVWNLHWMREHWDLAGQNSALRFPLRGQLFLQCLSGEVAAFSQNYDIVIDLGFERDEQGKLKFVSDSEQLHMVDCFANKSDCH